ncbi:MAG: calcium-binding protein [Planctomycetes bacterium]|nr:calcium-binding protein [Planctomycetota bacterium]
MPSLPSTVSPFRIVSIVGLAFAAAAQAQTTVRVSVSSAGVQGSLGSSSPSLSATGRFVAFRSASTNLVAGDTNGLNDIFVHDRQTGTTERVSVDSAGVQGNGFCGLCDISADGRYVVFESYASNLVAGDTNNTMDVFCRDRQTGTTTRVGIGASGQQSAVGASRPSVSADGRFVAFQSDDNNLVPGDVCVGKDVFLRDRVAGTTLLVSASNQTGQTFNSRQSPRVSDDGSTVVFDSVADDLVTSDLNGWNDVFVWTRLTGTLEIASVATNGAQGDRGSLEASVSADGRFVVFTSSASNFGAGTGPGNGFGLDVFVRDRVLGLTECISMSSTGVAATGSAYTGTITDDGRYVAFWSDSAVLVANDTNNVGDCFLRDRLTATTTRVSLSSSGLQARSNSSEPSVAASGNQIAFGSAATNIVIPDGNGTGDALVRDLTATAVALAYGVPCAGTSPLPAQAEGVGQPTLGNAGFALGVTNAFPSAAATVAVSAAPASIPVGSCTALLAGPVTLLPVTFTDIFGFTSAPLPIPATPALAGLTLFAQHLVFDPNGQFLGFAQLSQGLAITLN